MIRHALPRVRSGSIISRAPAASGALLIWLSNWCANGAQMLNQAQQCAQATAIGLMRPRAPQVSRVKPTLFGTECWVPTPVSPWTSPREEAEKCWRTDFLINPRVGARIEMTARDRLRCYFHPVSGAAPMPYGYSTPSMSYGLDSCARRSAPTGPTPHLWAGAATRSTSSQPAPKRRGRPHPNA